MKYSAGQAKHYWLALIAGVIAAILTYWMMQILGPLLAQDGLFHSWGWINSPPSRAVRILGATDGAYQQYDDIWIETQDGRTFSASVCTGYSLPCVDRPQWKSISKAPASSPDYTSGNDCKTLGEFPLDPSGQILECRYYVFWENDMETAIYYALMADGSLKYLVMDFSAQLKILLGFMIASALLYLAMFFLVFHLTKNVAKQVQTRKQRHACLDTAGTRRAF